MQFKLTPLTRGMKRFDSGQIRLRSTLDCWTGTCASASVSRGACSPNFQRQAAFEWLTGNRRLAELGIKSIRRRGSATDFDQLVDYRAGDAIRHID